MVGEETENDQEVATMAFDIAECPVAEGAVAERNIETITTEILQLKQDAGNAILGIGQR